MLEHCWSRSDLARAVLVLMVFAMAGAVFAQVYRGKDVSFEAGGHTFAGTLTLPDGAGPFPAVVLLTGSGKQDRDNAHPSLPGYRPFAEIADAMSGAGIAVLRYDERGSGASTGDFATATSFDLADDAEGAVAYLRTRGDIVPEDVGLLGHSEGAWLAALVAARNEHVAFVVALAGHAVPGKDVLPLQARLGLEAEGVPPDQIDAVLAEQKREIGMITARDWSGMATLLREQALGALRSMPEGKRPPEGQLDAVAQAQVEAGLVAVKGWLYTFLTEDPADAWEQVRVPVLAVFGGLDTQVDVGQNRQPMEAALARAGNDDVTVEVLPQANHLFLRADTAADAYDSLDPHVMPELLSLVTSWSVARVR